MWVGLGLIALSKGRELWKLPYDLAGGSLLKAGGMEECGFSYRVRLVREGRGNCSVFYGRDEFSTVWCDTVYSRWHVLTGQTEQIKHQV